MYKYLSIVQQGKKATSKKIKRCYRCQCEIGVGQQQVIHKFSSYDAFITNNYCINCYNHFIDTLSEFINSKKIKIGE